MLYLLIFLNIFFLPVIAALYMQYVHRVKNLLVQEDLQQLLKYYAEIMKNKTEILFQIRNNTGIGSPREPILEALDIQESHKIENRKLDSELQKIPIEALEKYLTKIHIINVLPYKYEKRNVIEAELLQHSISAKTGYYDAIRSVVKLQFTDKEDCIGINEIVAVEKNEDGKTMLYFTLQTSEIDAIVIPQVAFVSCIDES